MGSESFSVKPILLSIENSFFCSIEKHLVRSVFQIKYCLQVSQPNVSVDKAAVPCGHIRLLNKVKVDRL